MSRYRVCIINNNLHFLFLLIITISIAVVPAISLSSSSKTTTSTISQLAYAQQQQSPVVQNKQQHPNIILFLVDNEPNKALGTYGSGLGDQLEEEQEEQTSLTLY